MKEYCHSPLSQPVSTCREQRCRDFFCAVDEDKNFQEWIISLTPLFSKTEWSQPHIKFGGQCSEDVWLILETVAQGGYRLFRESTGFVGAAVVDHQWGGLADRCMCLRQQSILILEVAWSWCRRVGASKRTSQWGWGQCRGHGQVHWKSWWIHRHFLSLLLAWWLSSLMVSQAPLPLLSWLYICPSGTKAPDPREKYKRLKAWDDWTRILKKRSRIKKMT